MPSKLGLVFLLCLSCSLYSTAGYYEPWGKDCTLRDPSKIVESQDKNYSLGTRVADMVIRFHQQVLSPVDGPRSNFRPSSSRYMQLAMYRYGFFKGFIMGCDRLLRENDEEWVYRTIAEDGKLFKYDPAKFNKYE